MMILQKNMVRSKSNVQDIHNSNVQCCVKKKLQSYPGSMITDQDWSSQKVKCQRLKERLSPSESMCQNGSGSKKIDMRKLDKMSLDNLVQPAGQHMSVKFIKSAIITAIKKPGISKPVFPNLLPFQ